MTSQPSPAVIETLQRRATALLGRKAAHDILASISIDMIDEELVRMVGRTQAAVLVAQQDAGFKRALEFASK